MARYQLILAYDGTDFAGFQRQHKARTVQAVFESALKELGWQEGAILFAGRTDAGVHATGQVISFEIDWPHDDESLLNALNARLPNDVIGQRIRKADADFHPRYDAKSRTYHYTLYFAPQPNPLLDRFRWRIWPSLDGGLLNQAAQIFLGRKDFSTFGRAMKPGATTIREVFQSSWNANEYGWEYTIKANAFLYHMVRRLVFLQVNFARGHIDLADLVKGFDEKKVIKPGLAPSHGLELFQVEYDEESKEKLLERKN